MSEPQFGGIGAAVLKVLLSKFFSKAWDDVAKYIITLRLLWDINNRNISSPALCVGQVVFISSIVSALQRTVIQLFLSWMHFPLYSHFCIFAQQK